MTFDAYYTMNKQKHEDIWNNVTINDKMIISNDAWIKHIKKLK